MSSADPEICWHVWSDGEELTFTIRCTCGLIKKIYPDDNGNCYYEHIAAMCGWRVNLILDGYEEIKERQERRCKEKEKQ